MFDPLSPLQLNCLRRGTPVNGGQEARVGELSLYQGVHVPAEPPDRCSPADAYGSLLSRWSTFFSSFVFRLETMPQSPVCFSDYVPLVSTQYKR